MSQFAGFFGGGFCLLLLIVGGLSSLHRRSRLGGAPQARPRAETSLQKRAIISHALILPLSSLAFCFMTFASLRMVQDLHQQGQYGYALLALVFPTITFLVGFIYFRKTVNR